MKSDSDNFRKTIYGRVLDSELLVTYQNAFRCATGLPLRFVDADSSLPSTCAQAENGSIFCEKLSLCKSACNACIEVNRRLTEEAKLGAPASCKCFSGMSSTAVPVSCNGTLIGFLRTGQVFHSVPDGATFEKVSKTLRRQGLSESEAESLRDAYFQTQVVDPERYQSMITLLATFGTQLSRHAEKLAIVSENSEPEAISRARDFIARNLDEPLPLSLVARHAGLSESHFCRVFKEATGLTLTDYVNRRRIEWAKKELLKPEVRVSEIAFQIGYQSLSQFNRSFARFTGNSPTNFRREELSKLTAV
ncbi:helix-turn-helix domain-containing protein [Akkermansiaceae bacterium]|nr:helix-turn-helix domain-containing protein [Akkermansiaceae bacterium]